MNRYLWILAILLGLAGCEDLEDTYDGMRGDGPIRYLGKCDNMTVSPGWLRLRVEWVNNVDAVVDKLKLTWHSDAISGDTLLPRGTTQCDIPNLVDGSYEVRLCSVDKNGTTSLETVNYGRPYTLDHEVVLTFSRIVSKHIFVGNRLVLFFEDLIDENAEELKLPDEISDIYLNYTNINQEKRRMPLGTDEIAAKHMLLPEAIDLSEKVWIERKGHIDNSIDVIPLPDYELTEDGRAMSVDFKIELQAKYETIDEDFIQNLTELDLDYSLNSFEDILYFPNLKKLNLGKNRFLWDDDRGYNILAKYAAASEVYDLDRSLFVLDVAHELLGLNIDRYNQHYIPSGVRDYVNDKSNPEVPVRDFLNSDNWDISCSVKDNGSYNSYLEHLFDGDLDLAWQPEFNSTSDTYQITVDLTQEREKTVPVQGVQVVQRRFNPRNDRQYLDLMPSLISIECSADKVYWYKPTGMDGNTIGNSVGEITEIEFKESQDVRYLRFTVSDLPYYSNFAVSLAEIRVF